MSSTEKKDPVERLVTAYETMLKRVDQMLESAEKKGIPSIRRNIELAREKAVELQELTREEAEKVATYVERDMKDVANYLVETGDELRHWLRFDLDLIESRLREMFANVADQTSVQLRELADRAREASTYHTGEVTGLGTLACAHCGKELHFHKPGHIPPCPTCHGTTFRRVAGGRREEG